MDDVSDHDGGHDEHQNTMVAEVITCPVSSLLTTFTVTSVPENIRQELFYSGCGLSLCFSGGRANGVTLTQKGYRARALSKCIREWPGPSMIKYVFIHR